MKIIRVIGRIGRSISYLWSLIAIIMVKSMIQERVELRRKTRERLRYFNPTIKRNWLGHDIIEWVGRQSPLTDEELDKLI